MTIGEAVFDLTINKQSWQQALNDSEQTARASVSRIAQAFNDLVNPFSVIKSAMNGINETMRDLAYSAYVFRSIKDLADGATQAFLGQAAAIENITLKLAEIDKGTGTIAQGTQLANEQMAQLANFQFKTPFTLKELGSAFTTLVEQGQGTQETLQRVADTSAATGAPIGTLAEAYASLNSRIEDGGATVGRGIQQLVSMKAISQSTADTVRQQTQAGYDYHIMQAEVNADLDRYAGAAQRASETTTGLTGNLKKALDLDLADFGKPINDALKGPLQDLVNFFRSNTVKDAVTQWGQDIGSGVTKIWDAFKGFIPTLLSWFDQLKSGLAGINFGNIASLLDPLGTMVTQLMPVLIPAFTTLAQILNQLAADIMPVFVAVLRDITNILKDHPQYVAAIIGIWAGFKIREIAIGFVDLGASIVTAIGRWIGIIPQMTTAQQAAQNATVAQQNLATALNSSIGPMQNFANAFTQLGPQMQALTGQFQTSLTAILTAFNDTFSVQIPTSIAKGLGDSMDIVTPMMKQISAEITTPIQALPAQLAPSFESISTMFSTQLGGLMDIVTPLMEATNRAILTPMEAKAAELAPPFEAINAVFVQQLEGILTVVDPAMEAINAAIITPLNALPAEIEASLAVLPGLFETTLDAILAIVTVKATLIHEQMMLLAADAEASPSVIQRVQSSYPIVESTISGALTRLTSIATDQGHQFHDAMSWFDPNVSHSVSPVQAAEDYDRKIGTSLQNFANTVTRVDDTITKSMQNIRERFGSLADAPESLRGAIDSIAQLEQSLSGLQNYADSIQLDTLFQKFESVAPGSFGQFEQADAQLAKVAEAVGKAKDQYIAAEQALRPYKDALDSAQQALTPLKDTLDELNDSQSQLKDQIQSATDDLYPYQVAIDDLKDSLQPLVDAQQAEQDKLDDLKGPLDDIKNKIQDLKSANDEYKASIENQKGALDSRYNGEKRHLENIKDGLNETKRQREQSLEGVKHRDPHALDAINNQIAGVDMQLRSLDRSQSAMHDAASRAVEKSPYAQALRQQESALRPIQRAYNNQKQAVDKATEAVRKHNEEIHKAEEILHKHEAAVKSLTHEYNQNEIAVHAAQRAYNEQEGVVRRAQRAYDDHAQSVQKLKQKYDDLNSTFQDLQKQLQNVMSLVTTVFDAQQREAQAAQQALDAYNRKIEEAARAAQALADKQQSAADRASKAQAAATSAMGIATDARSEAQKELNAALAKEGELSGKLNPDKQAALDQEVARARQKLAAADAAVSEANLRVAESKEAAGKASEVGTSASASPLYGAEQANATAKVEAGINKNTVAYNSFIDTLNKNFKVIDGAAKAQDDSTKMLAGQRQGMYGNEPTGTDQAITDATKKAAEAAKAIKMPNMTTTMLEGMGLAFGAPLLARGIGTALTAAWTGGLGAFVTGGGLAAAATTAAPLVSGLVVSIDTALEAKKGHIKTAVGEGIGAAVGGGIGFAVGGPIGAAIGIAVGAIAGKWIGAHWDDISAKTSQVFGAVADIFKPGSAFANAVGGGVSYAVGKFGELKDWVGQQFPEIGKAMTTLGNLWGSISSGIGHAWDIVGGPLSSAWNTTWNGVKSVALDVWGWITEHWQTLLKIFVPGTLPFFALFDHWDSIWGKVKSTVSSIWDWITSNWKLLLVIFTPPIGPLTAMLSHWDSIWSGVKTTAETVWKALKAIIKDGINGVISGIDWLIDQLNKIQIHIPGINVHGVGVPGFDWNGMHIPRIPPVSFDVGAWNLPSTTFAMVHQGEMVVPQDFASGVRSALGASSNGSSSLDGLREAIQGQRDTTNQLIQTIKTASGQPSTLPVAGTTNSGDLSVEKLMHVEHMDVHTEADQVALVQMMERQFQRLIDNRKRALGTR